LDFALDSSAGIPRCNYRVAHCPASGIGDHARNRRCLAKYPGAENQYSRKRN
jgi:hypothetical protein